MSLDRCDTLVLVPRLVPCSANAPRDVGLSASTFTLVGAVVGDVGRVVLVSLVGAEAKQGGYLGALSALHRAVSAHGWDPTVIRASQIYGTPSDSGPLIDQLERTLERDATRLQKLRINPVPLVDVLDRVEDAVWGRLSSGFVDVVGARAFGVDAFIDEFASHIRIGRKLPLTNRFGGWPKERHIDRVFCDLLEAQSVALRRSILPTQREDARTIEANSEPTALAGQAEVA